MTDPHRPVQWVGGSEEERELLMSLEITEEMVEKAMHKMMKTMLGKNLPWWLRPTRTVEIAEEHREKF